MISNFKNITNPDQTPVDGDGISYELNGFMTEAEKLTVLTGGLA